MMRFTWISFVIFCAFIGHAEANTSYNLGGLHTSVQLHVLDLQKDAELIGMTKSAITELATQRLRKHKVAVDSNPKKAGLTIKITTLDVGPRLATHISIELKELARIVRHDSPTPTFVTTWNKARMVASEPTKHEVMVLRAVGELIDTFVKDSLL